MVGQLCELNRQVMSQALGDHKTEDCQLDQDSTTVHMLNLQWKSFLCPVSSLLYTEKDNSPMWRGKREDASVRLCKKEFVLFLLAVNWIKCYKISKNLFSFTAFASLSFLVSILLPNFPPKQAYARLEHFSVRQNLPQTKINNSSTMSTCLCNHLQLHIYLCN